MYKSFNNLPTSLNGSVSDSCDELIRGADEAQGEDDEGCAGEDEDNDGSAGKGEDEDDEGCAGEGESNDGSAGEGEGDEATTEVAQGVDEEGASDVVATEDDCESLKI